MQVLSLLALLVQSTNTNTEAAREAQRRAVQQEALRDLSDRYGQLLGERKLKSALLVMRDEAGAIEACCGVELAVADTQAAETLPRTEDEQARESRGEGE